MSIENRIEYVPPGLRHLLKDSLAQKRFKNREGYAVLQTETGETEVEGNMLEIYQQALNHVTQAPLRSAIVYEHRCNSTGRFIRDGQKEN